MSFGYSKGHARGSQYGILAGTVGLVVQKTLLGTPFWPCIGRGVWDTFGTSPFGTFSWDKVGKSLGIPWFGTYNLKNFFAT